MVRAPRGRVRPPFAPPALAPSHPMDIKFQQFLKDNQLDSRRLLNASKRLGLLCRIFLHRMEMEVMIFSF